MPRALIVCVIILDFVGGCSNRAVQPAAGGMPNALAVVQATYHQHGTGGILDREPRLFSLQVPQVIPYAPKVNGRLVTKTDKSFSWRSLNGVALPTTGNDQYNAGFCYVFAPVAALESSYMILHSGNTIWASEQHVANCCNGDGVRGGKATHAARYLVASGTTSGAANFEPYLTRPANNPPQPGPDFKVPCKAFQNSWPRYQADATDFVASDGGIPTAEQMKQAIIEHGPIVSFIYAGGSFGDFFDKADAGTTVITDDSKDGNHFVLITGWDDSKQAWEVRNSWGTRFGDHGFAWVHYSIRDITDNALWVHSR